MSTPHESEGFMSTPLEGQGADIEYQRLKEDFARIARN